MTMVSGHTIGRGSRVSAVRAIGALLVLAASLLSPAEARASLLSPELEDKLATFLALFVIFVVPCVLIALFWMVHILPEQIAHKRHHPQFEAIRTLCLLSLVFGGLLWPIAWVWAYSKPVMYKMAYGTDKHPDAHDDGPAPDEKETEVANLRDRLARLEGRVPEADLRVLRTDVEALEAKYAHTEVR
jgi:CBS domain containing-hemolysin-like protein